MDIRRTFLWVVFTVSILMLWDNWNRFNGRPSMFFGGASQQAKQGQGSNGAPAHTTAQTSVPSASTAAAPANVPGASAPAPAATPVQGERITITTDVVKAEIDTAGGDLKRLELLNHKEIIHREWYAAFLELLGLREKVTARTNVVLFDSSNQHTYVAQTGLVGGPFPNHKSAFVAKPGPRALDGATQVQLVLESEQNGVKLTKTYTFKRGEYTIEVTHAVTNATGAPISPTLYMQLVRDGSKPEGESGYFGSGTFTGPAVYSTVNHYEKIDFADIEKGKAKHVAKADNGWVAMVQHYFVSALVPPDKMTREIYTRNVATNLYSVGTTLPLGTLASGASTVVNAHLFAGPQETALLEKVAPGLDLVKDYGWLTIVAKPIFWLMQQLHNVLGNWGWTIVALTILIKLALFPLMAASYRSMARMKTVTPKMTAIRERHKGDPQKMNQAMMELYKTEKINPLGGCLPVLATMPVFIALYWVLLASVEMRNAPWIGWIHDLASPDPYYILPLIMAASMFIQTKLNPPPPDPMQAKIMMWMPIVFSVMFFFFPAGLVLYWVVNNIFSIAQQWVITKKIEGAK
ncbi:MAG: membrane protein insertase YidC [Burkholderiales bacterium]|nr:membrane protein insertase YidC [Burkholderiales bacterium]